MTEAELAGFVRHEARLIDAARWDEWLALFAEDGLYWVPLTPGQTDGIAHASLAHEDRLLLRIRIERLRDPHAHAQAPPSRCHHLLGQPETMPPEDGAFVMRTPFHYIESRGDAQFLLAGWATHHILATADGPRIRRKRVDLINCDAALPSIQLFP